jgi:hypothetical protein
MVCGKLRLIATRIARQRRTHHTSVIDQDMQCGSLGKHLIGKCIDRHRIQQIHVGDYNVRHLGQGFFCLGDVTCGHEDLRSGSSENPDRFQTDAGITPGHDGTFANQAHFAQNIFGG